MGQMQNKADMTIGYSIKKKKKLCLFIFTMMKLHNQTMSPYLLGQSQCLCKPYPLTCLSTTPQLLFPLSSLISIYCHLCPSCVKEKTL